MKFSKVQLSYATTLMLAISVIGCTQTSQTAQSTNRNAADSDAPAATSDDLPQVVATSTVLCDLTKQIAQETVAVTCLMQPDQDPHVYTPTPSDRKAIEDADLVLYGGYNYEPGLIKIISATQTPAPKVAVYEEAVPNPLMGEPHDHDHEAGAEADADHDHDHDPDHEAETAAGETDADHDHDHEAETAAATEGQVPDPHVWHDAQNGAEIVTVVSENLAQLVPDQADFYQQNAQALSQELSQLDDWIKTQVATVPEANRKLVTTHEALGYYANAYGFELEGAIEGLSTEERPSAARLTSLVEQLKAAEVPAIFVETTTNPKLLETVAKEANVEVASQPLFIEGPGGEGTPAATYQTMLTTNTCTIVESLGGKCDLSAIAKPNS
jgi:manganese/iron transport system substrate-binding protein